MKRTSRTPSNLSESLHQRLNSYALAASAAGVSTLALSQASQAKIVYTPAHVVLHARSNSRYYIDLNHDGVKDFTLSHGYNYSTTTGFLFSIIQMEPYKSNLNRIVGPGYAFALRAGAKVGPSNRFSHSGIMAVGRATGRSGFPTFTGSWANKGKGLQSRYLGLMFALKGKPHYGWARVSVSKYPFAATLTGYAYESIANKPIIAGKTHGKDVITLEPASLGHLAQGVSGLAAWRRTNSVAASH